MIKFKHRGNFRNLEKFLERKKEYYTKLLDKYGKEGVRALSEATPIDTGETASMWDYQIFIGRSAFGINWTNSNIVGGIPIAVLIQYGHGTGNGGYVKGRDYINPAIQPIFDKIANEIWAEVTK